MINTELKISDLIFSYIKGNISKENNQILQNWINESSKNSNLFNKLITKDSYITKSEILKRFNYQMRYENIKRDIRKQKIRRLYKYTSYAAAIILPLAIVSIFLLHDNLSDTKKHSSKSITPGYEKAMLYTADGKIINLEAKEFVIKDQTGNTISNKNKSLVYNKSLISQKAVNEEIVKVVVPRGGEYSIVLSDGTKVWLNSESSLEHPIVFLKDKRIVKVNGEAYFEVAHDISKPFIVIHDNTKVEVLGTKFNIRAYTEEGYTATTLVEGKVRAISGSHMAVTLSPSEQFIYDKEKEEYTTKIVDTKLYTSWKDGLFIFEKQRLEDILNTISRWYNIDVIYDNDKSKNVIFSGRLERYDNAEKLLNLFTKIEDVEFEIINENTILVK